MSFISGVMTLGVHSHVFCSDLVFVHWNKSRCAGMEIVDDVEAELVRAKDRSLHVFEVED